MGYVDHYYFYLVDRFWGPISIRFSSHPPFNVTVYLNGNRWLATEAIGQGLKIVTLDNSVVRCSDRAALQAIADSLDHRRLQALCGRPDHGIRRLECRLESSGPRHALSRTLPLITLSA
jgi:hypothetical protein